MGEFEEKIKVPDQENFVRVPISKEENHVREFKTYKILRRLKVSDDPENKGKNPPINYKFNESKCYESGVSFGKHTHPSLEKQRTQFPNNISYKYPNEGDKGNVF